MTFAELLSLLILYMAWVVLLLRIMMSDEPGLPDEALRPAARKPHA